MEHMRRTAAALALLDAPAVASAQVRARADLMRDPACAALRNTVDGARAIEIRLIAGPAERAVRAGDTLRIRSSSGGRASHRAVAGWRSPRPGTSMPMASSYTRESRCALTPTAVGGGWPCRRECVNGHGTT